MTQHALKKVPPKMLSVKTRTKRPIFQAFVRLGAVPFAVLGAALGTVSVEAVDPQQLQELCPGGLWARAPVRISLNDNESVLVCGDPKVEAWRNVPLNQAMVHLSAILQERGFQFPKMVTEEGRAIVDVGPRSEVQSIEVEGHPPADWRVKRFRKVRGEVLTPTLLGSFQKRVEADLRRFGYACPVVKTDAFARSERLRLTVHAGQRAVVRSVKIDPVDGLEPQALERFYAFFPGAVFDHNALLLSSQRMETDGILQSTYFETTCDPGFADLHQKHMAGAPRILRFGGGLNTERGLIGYIEWKHARIGRLGSSFNVGTKFSYRDSHRNIQQVTAAGKWYGLMDFSRLYFDSTLTATHESHENYRIATVNQTLLPSTTWDTQNFGGTISFGPTLNASQTFRGPGRPRTFYSTLRGSVRIIEHDLELNYADPTSGLELRAQAEASDDTVFSDISTQSFIIDGRWLWNIANMQPATYILAFRWRLNATLAPASQGGYASLPIALRNYMGGSYDMRGYALKELPGPIGAPTIAYVGSEFRLAEILPWGLQPLVLFDIGRVGSNPLTLNSPVYFSVGPGMRWESPIGVFRMTLARGWASGRPYDASQSTLKQWQFLIGFGEEF